MSLNRVWDIQKIKFTRKDDANVANADQVMNVISENFFNEPYGRKQLSEISGQTSDGYSTELTSTRKRRDEDAEIEADEQNGPSEFKHHRGTVIRITCYKFVRWYISKLKILEYTVYGIRLHSEERCFGKHRVWKQKQDGSVIDVTHKKEKWREENENENADELDGTETSRRRRGTQKETQPASSAETCADSDTCWLRHPDIVVDNSDIYFNKEVGNGLTIKHLLLD